jgi:hypothetical protein
LFLKKAAKAAKESILEMALFERKKYPETMLKLYGKNIYIIQSGTYKYDHYDDWNKIKTKLETIQENMKLSLQAWKKGQTIVDEDTGEVIPPASYKSSKESLKLS